MSSEILAGVLIGREVCKLYGLSEELKILKAKRNNSAAFIFNNLGILYNKMPDLQCYSE